MSNFLLSAPARMQEKVSHFPAGDYHLHALRPAAIRVGPAAIYRGTLVAHISQLITTRRMIMAKGQQRKTKEAKKPKKQPPPATLTGAIS
jgi:hypothetical protein